MDWDVIASSRIGDLTQPKSCGRPTNGHVVQGRQITPPDYARMRDIVHHSAINPRVVPAA